MPAHSERIWSLSFSPDGRYLASGSEDRSVIVWDVARQRERFTLFGNSEGVNAVLYSPDGGQLIVGGEDGALRLWNFHTGHSWKRPCLSGGVNALAFAPNGRMLASGGGLYNSPGLVKLWDPARGQETARLYGHDNEVMTLAFSPSGRHLLSADFDGVLKLWDLENRKVLQTMEGHRGAVWKVDFHWNDHTLISGGEDGKVRFWEAATGRCLCELPGIAFGVLSFALSPDGQQLAIASFDGTVKLVPLGDPWRPVLLGQHREAAFTVAFAPDGRTVASAGMDRQLALWNLDAGAEAERHSQPSPVRYRPRFPVNLSLN